MQVRPTKSRIWSVTVPIIFAGVGETIIDVTDTIFIKPRNKQTEDYITGRFG